MLKTRKVFNLVGTEYNKINKILIVRDTRGIGDILTCRMLFKTFKEAIPNKPLVFACWKEYHSLLNNHPFLDEVIDSKGIRRNTYICSYNITNPCIYYESVSNINGDMHRADIWANHCGLSLKDHDMHLPFINEKQLKYGEFRLSSISKNTPTVLFSPFSYESMRSLTKEQIESTVNILRKKGLFVFACHNKLIPIFDDLKVPVLISCNFDNWMAYIHAADCVVTVDTATFHYAGGINKPMTGIFTHVDGKLRGKYFDFILVQKHKDNGNWPCGPCYDYLHCTNPRCKDPESPTELRPCLTELTSEEIEEGIDKMLAKWTIL